VGRIWVTLDGRELISFDTSTYLVRRATLARKLASGPDQDPHAADAAAVEELRRAGEYDDYSALVDLETYLSLSIEDALASPSPLHRALAVIDGRIGKRRLRKLAPMTDEHPLVRELFAARCAAEGVPLNSVRTE
jgi:hypothetical protein